MDFFQGTVSVQQGVHILGQVHKCGWLARSNDVLVTSEVVNLDGCECFYSSYVFKWYMQDQTSTSKVDEVVCRRLRSKENDFRVVLPPAAGQADEGQGSNN